MTEATSVFGCSRPIKVLIIDDSALVRSLLSQMLAGDTGIEVVDTASDAYDARKKIKQYDPDVVTLDVEMPGMNGLQFLRNLMRLRPMPVVMISSLTAHGTDAALQALAIGAVDYICKPKVDLAHSLQDHALAIISKIKIASQASVSRFVLSEPVRQSQASVAIKDRRVPQGNSQQIVAIGASTGGIVAVRDVLGGLKANDPAVVVVQHLTDAFTDPFIKRLNETVPSRVLKAEHDQVLQRGCVYVAPSNAHLRIKRCSGGFRCVLTDEGPISYHRPSVDALFHSVAREAGRQAIGIILTGMGRDGVDGLCAMRKAGAHTIAQDEQSSVVWGMPRAAVTEGGAVSVLPLREVAQNARKHLAAARLAII